MKWHPDKNKDDPSTSAEMFKLVAEAFEVLSDPEKRQIYDQYGRDGVKHGVKGNDVDFDGFHFDFSDAASLFEQFFGNDPFFGHTGGIRLGGFNHGGNRFQQQQQHGIFGDFGFTGRDPFSDFATDNFFSQGFTGILGADSFEKTLGFGSNFGARFGESQSASSSFQSSTGGISRSTRTTTKIVNGQRVMKTVTTVRYPDGRTETQTSTSNNLLDGSDSRQSLHDWH